VVAGVFVLQEDLWLVFAQPVVHAVGIADGQVLLRERRMRGGGAQRTAFLERRIEAGLRKHLIEGREVLLFVDRVKVAGRVLGQVNAMRRVVGQVLWRGVRDLFVQTGERLERLPYRLRVVQDLGALNVLFLGDGAAGRRLAQLLQLLPYDFGVGLSYGGRNRAGRVEVEAQACWGARLLVDAEEHVEQLVVALGEAARSAHGLPFVGNEAVADGDGLVKLDAHLAVLAPASCQLVVVRISRRAYLHDRLTGGLGVASASVGMLGARSSGCGRASEAMMGVVVMVVVGEQAVVGAQELLGESTVAMRG
jgi:hypothetical protein